MTRRVAKRRKRGRLVVTVILAGATVLVAVAVWRSWPTQFSEPRSEPRLVEPPKPSALPKSEAEDFSAAERQDLEDILKRHGTGKQQ